MLKLAEQLAKLMNTHILDHKIYDDEIVFVLASGSKLRYTEDGLKAAIKSLSPAPKADEPKAVKEPKVKSE